MKKLITGLSLGIVIGASALLGAVQIPSVRSALSRVNIIPSVESADKLEDGDPITATSVITTATTDGYDIYHTIEIKYSASDTSHTLVINLKNDKLVSSTLDSEDYTLIKN